jgi:hypothetical protein
VSCGVPAEAGEFALEHPSLQAIGVACALHHSPVRYCFAAHEEGDADDALVADHGDLCGSAVLHDVQQGDDGGGGKIDMAQLLTRLVEGHPERQRDQFQVSAQVLDSPSGKASSR